MMKKSSVVSKNLGAPSSSTAKKTTSSSSVRNFIAENRKKATREMSRPSPIFHDEKKTNDLSPALVKIARKSGVLNLSGRNLNTVPSKVWSINHLDDKEKKTVSVSLDDNAEDKWWDFVDLQKLIIANNAVTKIPADISNLPSLQTLDAHDNQISFVATEIESLEFLQKCDISRNKIITLPDGFFQLKRLTELNLCHNSIEEMPGSLGQLNCLRVLDLSNNKLSTVPPEIGYLSFCTHLNLSHNMLTELPEDISGLTALRRLNLTANRLTKTPKSLGCLGHLEVLRLDNNALAELPNVENCKSLIEVYLQNNKITKLYSSVFSETKVQLLDLRSNKIYSIELDRYDLEFLDRLYLDNNDISSIPDQLALLPSIKALTLEGNPLRGIRLDVLQRGTQEVLKYLRGKLKASSESREIPESSGEEYLGSTLDRTTGPYSSPPGHVPVRSPRASTEKELGVDVYKLKASRNLNLSSKNMKAVEDDVFETATTAGVSELDISKNFLTFLPPKFETLCPLLTTLNIDFNKFTSLPDCIAKNCSRLQFLSFQNNAVESMSPEFAALQQLREINFSYNKFTEFPECLYSIPSLEIIICATNKITKIDADKLSNLKRLAVFDIRNNNVAHVPPELGLLTQLRSLNIEGNAFKVPNYQILSRGTEAILRYLQNRIVK